MEQALAKMKIGKVFIKNIPQLEIIAERENGETSTFYLSPFRAYGFQVSETDDGQWSRGQSEFIGLEYIVRANEKAIAKAIFRAMAGNALTAHNQHYKEIWDPSFEEAARLEAFITDSYTWVRTLVKKQGKGIQKTFFEDFNIGAKYAEKQLGFINRIKLKIWKKQA